MITMNATEFRRRIAEIERLVAIGETIVITRHRKVVFIIKSEKDVDINKLMGTENETVEKNTVFEHIEECHCEECEEPFVPNYYNIPMKSVLIGKVEVYEGRKLVGIADDFKKIKEEQEEGLIPLPKR